MVSGARGTGMVSVDDADQAVRNCQLVRFHTPVAPRFSGLGELRWVFSTSIALGALDKGTSWQRVSDDGQFVLVSVPTSVRTTRTVPPGRSSAVLGYPAAGPPVCDDCPGTRSRYNSRPRTPPLQISPQSGHSIRIPSDSLPHAPPDFPQNGHRMRSLPNIMRMPMHAPISPRHKSIANATPPMINPIVSRYSMPMIKHAKSGKFNLHA
jgi:hypothetical protein